MLTLACGLACNSQGSPQSVFDQVLKTFEHGKLEESQNKAKHECERLKNADPEWAWKFRILQAESLLWRGMYSEALAVLNIPLSPPKTKDSLVEIFAIKAAAHARLHEFSDADGEIAQAIQICEQSSSNACGDVMRAQGALAVQRGQTVLAKERFEDSLQFARTRADQFLEETSLLDLGATALRDGHFDEAIDWTNAAYQKATILEAAGEVQAALGNLGWAYYNLGDSEKSLALSLRAEDGATKVGDIIDQLSWITNTGYVYADNGDFTRAKNSYLKAYTLAAEIRGKEDIYNALRALALVSEESGDLDGARRYADQAIAMARADKNREDELYPLLIKGLVAAASGNPEEGEQIFREVEQDHAVSPSLQWRAQHALARTYGDRKLPTAASTEYQTALSTFEAARSSLQRPDSRLPFSHNAAHLYDDYIHFLVGQGKTNDALRWADYSRARTLAEGLGLLPRQSSASPGALNSQAIAQRTRAVILFYWLGKQSSFLWAITPTQTRLFTLPAVEKIEAAVDRYRKALEGPQDVLGSSNGDARYLYETLIRPAQALLPKKNAKVIVIPDGRLNDLNFETLVVPGDTPHFWIEGATILNASSLRLLASSRPALAAHARSLLLIGNAVSPSSEYPELPNAQAEMSSVAGHFSSEQAQMFQREQATAPAYFGADPEKFSYIHFVAHGMASRLSPLDSAIVLSKSGSGGENFKLYARDIIQHPIKADLVTISACYGAGTRAYSGEGLVGLSWAFLRAGAHNVIAALWEASDVSTAQLMDRFYDGLGKGKTPEAALREAKLALLHSSGPFHKPQYWAAFQLYAGSGS